MNSAVSSVQYEKRTHPFPTDPLERAGNILAAYNSSVKAITQLLVTRIPATRLELSKRFEALVTGTTLETTDSYNVNGYCSHTLCPLGLVVSEKMPSSGRHPYVITYSLTEAGIRYGQPAAAAFLIFEQENGFSLFPILGATFSANQEDLKPPLTRAMLLCELAKGDKQSVELAASLHRSVSMITRSLTRLARSGAITYNTLDLHTDETQVVFSVTDTAAIQIVAPVHGYSQLTPAIAQICIQLDKRHIPITQSAVSALLRKKQERKASAQTLRNMVSDVLAGLVEQGYLRRLQFSRENKSMATITTKGLCVVEKLIKPLIEAMQDGATLNRWQQTLLPKVQNQLPFFAEQTATLFYPLSKSRDKLDRPDRLALLRELLQKNKGITVTQLARKLRVSQMTVSAYLCQLEATDPVTRTRHKSVAYYSMANNETVL
jgi:DNA-binding MarR family transcriptional regulator